MTDKAHLIYGFHAVEAALAHSENQVQALYVQQGRPDKRVQALVNLAEKYQIPIQTLSKQQLDQLTQGALHQGIVAKGRPMKQWSELDLEDLLGDSTKSGLLLVLDGIQDPHNLGACLRTANAAGAQAVIAPKDKAVGITSVVRKVASGAAEQTPFIQVTNLARTLKLIKEYNFWVYGLCGEAETSLYQTDLRGSVAIVMGAEGQGLRRLTRESCDVLLSIPVQGSVSSLNVSVATGVCLFEIVRQRL